MLSDKKNGVTWPRGAGQQGKHDVKNISETFVKIAFYFLWIREL